MINRLTNSTDRNPELTVAPPSTGPYDPPGGWPRRATWQRDFLDQKKSTHDYLTDDEYGVFQTFMEVSPLASARLRIALTQNEFAKMLGVSLRTLQEWEQGRRTPSGAAKSLITIAIRKPEVLKQLLAA
jgi:DNA-binding transcriptional regulator YiaG